MQSRHVRDWTPHRPGNQAADLSDNSSVAPARSVCMEKERLLEELTAAVSDYFSMQSDPIVAESRGQRVLLKVDIETARKRKEEAKRAIRAHQAVHGC